MERNLRTDTGWLHARTQSLGVGVDRKAEVIRGVVIAQEGLFKSEGRGRFTRASLDRILQLGSAAPNGLKSRFTHPTLSADGAGTHLGRIRNLRMDSLGMRESAGQVKSDPVAAIRGDLYLDPSAHKLPGKGDVAEWLMTAVENDPDSLSTSLVIRSKKEWELDAQGNRVKDANGEELPRIWTPTALHSSDVVDTGDAVDGMLAVNVDGMPDAIVREAYALASEQFENVDAETAANRLHGWVDRFVEEFYGKPQKTLDPKTIRAKLRNRGRYSLR